MVLTGPDFKARPCHGQDHQGLDSNSCTYATAAAVETASDKSSAKPSKPVLASADASAAPTEAPRLILGPLRDPTCLVKCLRWLVRVTINRTKCTKAPTVVPSGKQQHPQQLQQQLRRQQQPPDSSLPAKRQSCERRLRFCNNSFCKQVQWCARRRLTHTS